MPLVRREKEAVKAAERRVLRVFQKNNPNFGNCGPASRASAMAFVRTIVEAARKG